MPLYEYQCVNCNERVEIIQKHSDPPQAPCPSCGNDIKRLLSAPAIQFKGSGFYKTDYASGSSSASTSGGTKSDSSSGDGKSDTKTETKSDTKTTDSGSSKSE